MGLKHIVLTNPTTLAPNEDLSEASFREFIRLNVARANAAPATVENYVREARGFRSYLATLELPIADVSRGVVAAWVAQLVESGFEPTTIALKVSAVRRLLDAAVDAGILATNPAAGVQGPKDRRLTGAAAQRTLDVAELIRLLQAAASHDVEAIADRDRAIVALLAGHGLRTVEIHRLSLADVNLSKKTIVAHGKTRDRVVFLRADVAERLAVVLERRIVESAQGHDAVFVSHGRAASSGKGERLSRRGIRFVVDRAYRAAGLIAEGSKAAASATGTNNPTTHGLRASYITMALENGAPIQDVAVDVGHADARTTMRYQDHANRRARNTAHRIPVGF